MMYGCIGEKLTHSFSSEIHRRLFDYSYELKEISPDQLADFMSRRNFKGINVTMPYKQLVLPYLDEIDETARAIGAVNTVVNRNGRLYGYNTDYLGLAALIRRSGIDLRDRTVLIAGSGGTSRTAYAVAMQLGCREAVRLSRSGAEDCLTYDEAKCQYRHGQVLINTTPVGMYPQQGEMPLSLEDFPDLEGVVDVVYNPLSTALVCAARQKNIVAVGGLYMLVAQAAYAAQLFTDVTVAEDTVDSIYFNLMKEKQNVVLIGMPTCGKTTVGKQLAERLGFDFVDSDEYIEEQADCRVADIFAREGEASFRERESRALRELSCRQSTVIATGGGAVLQEENVLALKGNGRIYFLDRSLSLLTPAQNRPLSTDRESLKRLYEERYNIYCTCADMRINADGSVEEIVSKILMEDAYDT